MDRGKGSLQRTKVAQRDSMEFTLGDGVRGQGPEQPHHTLKAVFL